MITWGKRMHGVQQKMGTPSPRWAQTTQPFPTSLRLLLKPGEPTLHGDSHTTEAQHTLHEKHLLRILSVCVGSAVSDSCDPVDCSLPGSSVHGDCPGKNTEVSCHFLLQGIFQPQD